MAELEQLKKARKFRSSNFTKKLNNLNAFLNDADSPYEGANDSFTAVKEAYEALEKAHEEYFMEATEDETDTEGDYLLIPSKNYGEVQIRFHKFKANREKRLEEKKKKDHDALEVDREKKQAASDKAVKAAEFTKIQAEFVAAVKCFKAPCDKLVQMQNSGVAFSDFRKVLNTIGGERGRLLTLVTKLSSLKPTAEGEVNAELLLYNTEVEDVYQEYLIPALEYLKDAPEPVTTTSSSGSGLYRALSRGKQSHFLSSAEKKKQLT